MANINLVREGARGCGYKKTDSFYIRSEGAGIECGFLPIDLPEKPADPPAGARSRKKKKGEKPKREKRYFKPSLGPSFPFIGDVIPEGQKCSLPEDPLKSGGCQGCWVRSLDPSEKCVLLWVGMSFYKSTEHFLQEAGRIGISRKIPKHVIKNITIGKTPVFLAHREASRVLDTTTNEVTITRQVFRAFIPSRIEYVVNPKTLALDKRTKAYKNYIKYLDQLEEQGITLIQVEKAGTVLDLFGEN
jgi:hypothetical protein